MIQILYHISRFIFRIYSSKTASFGFDLTEEPTSSNPKIAFSSFSSGILPQPRLYLIHFGLRSFILLLFVHLLYGYMKLLNDVIFLKERPPLYTRRGLDMLKSFLSEHTLFPCFLGITELLPTCAGLYLSLAFTWPVDSQMPFISSSTIYNTAHTT